LSTPKIIRNDMPRPQQFVVTSSQCHSSSTSSITYNIYLTLFKSRHRGDFSDSVTQVIHIFTVLTMWWWM